MSDAPKTRTVSIEWVPQVVVTDGPDGKPTKIKTPAGAPTLPMSMLMGEGQIRQHLEALTAAFAAQAVEDMVAAHLGEGFVALVAELFKTAMVAEV